MGKFGGPTDLLVMLTAALILTGIVGTRIWIYSFAVIGHTFAINQVIIAVVTLGSIFSTLN
jgi:hypothetical protein